ncbi:hypothetical protein FRC03_000817 [Tulasnella sp. 419]|nr:hypothetical protein FRC03_000817 [Tulasnella sp. 419]
MASIFSPPVITMGGLGVAARLPLRSNDKAFAYLMPMEERPLLHQIWVVECGRHGYYLRNASIDSYLNYYRTEAILESNLPGCRSVSEWSFAKKEGEKQPVKAGWRIKSCTDENIVAGVNIQNPPNKLRATSSSEWSGLKGRAYLDWQLEPVEEKWIDFSSDIAAVAQLLRQSCI